MVHVLAEAVGLRKRVRWRNTRGVGCIRKTGKGGAKGGGNGCLPVGEDELKIYAVMDKMDALYLKRTFSGQYMCNLNRSIYPCLALLMTPVFTASR